MGLQFLRPAWLLALLLVPLVVWLGRESRRLAPRRRRWSVALRAVVLAVVVLALAQPRLLRAVHERGVAFLLDVSDSVPSGERVRAEEFVADALDGMPADDRAAVIAFGDRALVDRPARFGPLDPPRSVPGRKRTDIGSALRLGLTVLPGDMGRRLVLLSDGRANQGSLERQIDLAAAQGVPIDVVPLAAAASAEEVLIRGLDAPANTRIGQRFDLAAVVRATAPTGARIQIFSDDEVLYDREVDLVAGDNRFSVPVTVAEPGFHRYRAVIAPQRDGRPENNQAAAFTVAAGAPKVMVVAGVGDRAGPLMSALEGADRHPRLLGPAEVPTSLLGLSEYESVILVDVPARDLSGDTMRALEAFVRDLGHGLVMIGGEDSFGAGGYKDTPVEKALPVDMEVRDKEKQPDIAITFVIDKSGSMSECGSCGSGGWGGSTAVGDIKVELAKEAVMQAAALLEPDDQVALVAFDGSSHTLWRMQPHQAPGKFEDAVAGIYAGGGTNIHAGLVAGVDQSERAAVPLKHIILLTDGWSDSSGYGAVLARMNSAQTTLSVVAVGQGSAPYLEDLALDGGGRYYAVEDAVDVPQVFVEETMTTMGTFIVEERFQPKPGSRSQILSGLDAAQLPPLNGYNGTTEKQSSRVVVWSHLEDPILAQWHYGLGRSVAWTSDLKRQWAADWVGWDPFPDFAVQLVDWTLPAPDDAGFVTDVTLDGARATITLRATDESGGAVNFLAVESRLSGPDGKGLVVPLTQTAAGEYVGTAELAQEGTYLLRVIGRQDGEVVGSQTSGFVVPYSPEYADPSDQPTDPRLWRLAELTGGRVLDAPEQAFDPVGGVTRAADAWPWLFLLAALLFPVDVAVRRLKLNRSDLQDAWAWIQERRPGLRRPAARLGGERVLGTLFAARDRARARMGEDSGEAPDDAWAGVQGGAGTGFGGATGAGVPTTGDPGAVGTGTQEETECSADQADEGEPGPEDTLSRLKKAKRRAKR